MSMRTIYIRKENEAFFDTLPKKSETINAILDKLRAKKNNEVIYTEVEPYA
jgi:hypothetical protein